MNPYFIDFAEYMSRFFPGVKVQKISVNTGGGCPNRDGTVGRGGCIYCDNSSFTPAYCLSAGSVASQIEEGKRFFARKYPDMKYLAYFQSFTPTHGVEATRFEALLEEAASCEGVVGIIVGTRPDSLPQDIVAVMERFNHRMPLFVEIGVESMHDVTLRAVNRGHTVSDVEDAVRRLSDAGLHVGVHLIAGLPGEDDDDVLDSVERCCRLGVDSIKLHHLQVLRGTPLCRMVERGEVSIRHFAPEDYIALCRRVVRLVGRRVAIERFLASAPPEKVVYPKWGIKNYEFTNALLRSLESHENEL